MIELTNATNFEIKTEFWHIVKQDIHLPSITATSILMAGYGGYGVRLIINNQFYKYDELEAIIYKNNSNYSYKSDIDKNNSCILIPNGGNLNDYSITIGPKRSNWNL